MKNVVSGAAFYRFAVEVRPEPDRGPIYKETFGIIEPLISDSHWAAGLNFTRIIDTRALAQRGKIRFKPPLTIIPQTITMVLLLEKFNIKCQY